MKKIIVLLSALLMVSSYAMKNRKSLDEYKLHVTTLILKHCLFPVHNCLYALRRFMDYNYEVGFVCVLAGD